MKNSLISDALGTTLCNQIGHEFFNANFYLYIAAFLKNKGLDNLAKQFEHQWEEENSHGKMLVDLLNDLNGDVFIPSIKMVKLDFISIIDIARAYLEREILTTQSLNEIKIEAASETDPNPVVEERIRHMILLQQREYEEATKFMDKAESFPEWWQVSLWDTSLG